MTMGIYKMKNILNNKVYIGQSTNISSRKKAHKNNHSNQNLKDYPTNFYRALRKHGFSNFTHETIEIVDSIEKLEEREIFWISYYDSYKKGYNSTPGGCVTDVNENHPMSKLTNKQVKTIKKELVKNKKTEYQLSKIYNISQSIISEINTGDKWSTIGIDDFPIRKNPINRSGEKNHKSILTDKEVVELRDRYVNETAREIYNDYKDRCSYITIERALNGRTYSYLPIYKKRRREWV